MKKLTKLFLILIITSLLSGCNLSFNPTNKQEPKKQEEINSPRQEETQIVLTLDFGDEEIATYSGITAKTAFEALEKVSQVENFEIKTKQYDFGVFIEAINKKENTENKSWMYYVNNKLADKAADKFELNNKDQVLFKYEKPKF